MLIEGMRNRALGSQGQVLTNWALLWFLRSLMVILVQGSGLWLNSSLLSRKVLGEVDSTFISPPDSSFTTTVGGHSGPSLSRREKSGSKHRSRTHSAPSSFPRWGHSQPVRSHLSSAESYPWPWDPGPSSWGLLHRSVASSALDSFQCLPLWVPARIKEENE